MSSEKKELKLFKVSVLFEEYAVGTDYNDAIKAVLPEIPELKPIESYADEVKDKKFIPKAWKGCLPYGAKDEDTRTVEDYVP